MKLYSEIEQLLLPLIESLGYELWAVEYFPQGKHSILRVLIDRDQGISLSDCERVSREVSGLLDVEDPIPGVYNLEISSPGIPRPLLKPAHYIRYIGSEIQLKLRQPIAGTKKINAVIQSADEQAVTLAMGEESLTLPYSQIVKANLISE